MGSERGEEEGGGGGDRGPAGRASRGVREAEEAPERGGLARERLWEQRHLRDGGGAAAELLHRPAAHSPLGPGPPRSIAPPHWRSAA